jgi:hypothetical protein
VIDERPSFDGALAVGLGGLEPYGRIASGFATPNLEERFYRGPVHSGMVVIGEPTLRRSAP